MKVRINGETANVPERLNIAELLIDREVRFPDMVSVELNGRILNKDIFHSTELRPNDAVEFLYFMGGGSRETV